MANRATALSTAENCKLQNNKRLSRSAASITNAFKLWQQVINFDLDDGVVVNYVKFGDVLSKIK